MGNIFEGIPEELSRELKKLNGIDCFVETGTNKGNTAAWAAKVFEKVFTIELSPVYVKIAEKKLRHYENVELLEGDSAVLLGEVLKKNSGKSCFFWLDAHWCGKDTGGFGEKAPVVEELKMIMATPETHCILIDDARFFKAPLSLQKGEYPDLLTLSSVIDPQKYRLYVVDDVIAILPADDQNIALIHSYVWKHDFLRARRTFEFYFQALKNGNFKGIVVGLLLLLKLYKYQDASSGDYLS